MADEVDIEPPGADKCSTHPPDPLVGRLARKQHGVVARRQLLELGLSRHQIAGRTERGVWRRVHRGVYLTGHVPLSQHGRWMAAVLASESGAVLSHRSAAGLWNLLPHGRRPPEVTRPRGFRSVVGIVAHRSVLLPDEVEEVDGIPATSVARTLLDLAGVVACRQERTFTAGRLERAFNEAEVRGLTSRVSVPELLARHAGTRGVGVLLRLLEENDAAAGIAKEELEARFAELLRAHRVPAPRRNADLAVRGRFFNVDCLWRHERVIVELDGRAVHGTARAFERDRKRDRLLTVDRWRVMRVTWAQLRDEPEAIVADLKGLLATRDA